MVNVLASILVIDDNRDVVEIPGTCLRGEGTGCLTR